jgi:IclR family transcriptional regulator, KDG regulon repressor
MLIDASPKELEERFATASFPINTTTSGATGRVQSITQLKNAIAFAKRRGFATVDEEFEPGLVGASAPVRDFTGRIVAAINVSLPKARLMRKLADVGTAAQEAADTLSQQLGHQPQ